MAGQNTAQYLPHNADPMRALEAIPGRIQALTLTGTLTLDSTYPAFLKADPGGANRDVALETPTGCSGLYRRIVNAADAAENLVVKSGVTTVGTINQNEQGEFWWDGSAWALLCITTIALS